MEIIKDEFFPNDKVWLVTNGGNIYGRGIVFGRKSAGYEAMMIRENEKGSGGWYEVRGFESGEEMKIPGGQMLSWNAEFMRLMERSPYGEKQMAAIVQQDNPEVGSW